MHQYSKVDRDLRALFTLMSLRGDLELERHSHVGNLSRDSELEKTIGAISRELQGKFEFLQSSTARQVLFRCLKNAELVDAGTAMEAGADPREAVIERLQARVVALDMEVDSVTFERIEVQDELARLKKNLVLRQQELRGAKMEISEHLHKLHEQRIRIRELESDAAKFGEVLRGKNFTLQDLELDRRELIGKLQTSKLNCEHLSSSLEAKRAKK